MKTILTIIFLVSSVAGLAQERIDFSIKPYSKSVLRIKYENNVQLRSVSTYCGNVLPYGSDVRKDDDSILVGTGEKYIVFNVCTPQQALLHIDNRGSTIYLIPNDTLTLHIDLSQARPWHKFYFAGIGAAINQYYFDQAKALIRIPNRARAQLCNYSYTLSEYSSRMDSLLRVEQNFLKEYTAKHVLPFWFIEQERLQIVYDDASYRANCLSYRVFMKMDSSGSIPKNYFSFVTPALLNNSSAAHLREYHSFIKDYFFNIYNQQKAVKDPSNMITTLTNKHLTGLAWEVFMARHIGEALSGHPTEGEALLRKYYSRFKHKKWLDDAKVQYKVDNTLNPGQMAPLFALEDQVDSLAYLKDFKGQVVYLSFWFTGCAPCREEMPHENELVQYFSGKPVKIISICLHSLRSDWMKVSKRYELQTVNLFANKSWGATLVKKYDIKAYPHYVLINQDGVVVKNNCVRPSAGIKKEIEALLEK